MNHYRISLLQESHVLQRCFLYTRSLHLLLLLRGVLSRCSESNNQQQASTFVASIRTGLWQPFAMVDPAMDLESRVGVVALRQKDDVSLATLTDSMKQLFGTLHLPVDAV